MHGCPWTHLTSDIMLHEWLDLLHVSRYNVFVKSSSFEPSYSNISSSNKSKSDSDRMYFLDLVKIIPE